MPPRPNRLTFGPIVARGGFGEVYVADLTTPGGMTHKVAVKLLREDLDARGDPVRRLREEARSMNGVAHPAVVRVHDLAHIEGQLALVTEWVPGRVLSEMGSLDQRPVVEMIGKIADALAAIHGSCLVHRDVKPANIVLTPQGHVRLLDFGISWCADAERIVKTKTGTIVGSMAYMAPERFHTSVPDPAWDVFALGLVMYELLAAHRLLDGESATDVASMVSSPSKYNAVLRRASSLEVGPGVSALLADLLAFDPRARPLAAACAERCDALRDRLPGSTLSRWCRAGTWVEPRGEPGPLTGLRLDAPSAQVSDGAGETVSFEWDPGGG